MKVLQNSPGWHIALFAFMCGVAVTAALLIPIATPDHQRGYLAGYAAGTEDAKRLEKDNYSYGFADGVRSVKH